MEIKLIRETFTNQSTIGRLLIDGCFYGWTLEDVDRHLEEGGKKIYGQTAIPLGRYRVIINKSARFKKDLPLLLNVPQFEGIRIQTEAHLKVVAGLLNVPQFEGIRIHSGNTPADTEGCILPGLTKGVDCVNHSRAAFNDIFERIQSALKKGDDVFITIKRSGDND